MLNDECNLGFIRVESILYALTRLFSEVQQALDMQSLVLPSDFLEFENVGFSFKDNCIARFPDKASGDAAIEVLPLLSLVSFRKCQISELIVEFPVIGENHPKNLSTGHVKFRIISFDPQVEPIQFPSIKLTEKKSVIAEFQIDGEIKEILVI